MRIREIDELRDEEWAHLRSTRPIVLFGSHLSTYHPLDLPSGGQVTKTIYDFLFPKGTGPDSGSWPSWLRQDMLRVPFEAFMELHPDQDVIPDALVNLYGRKSTNLLYEVLAGSAFAGKLGGFVTTNYDLALEVAAASKGGLVRLVDEAAFAKWNARPTDGVPFLKLHGSAEARYRGDLVFTLRHEGRLQEWKRVALRALLGGRVVVILGFSGSDFDVCPELARAPIAELFWLQPSQGDFGPNARRVLEDRGGQGVVGDVRAFMERLLGVPVEAESRSPSLEGLSPILRSEVATEWKTRLLDRIGCERLARFAATGSLDGRRPEDDWLWSSLCGHAGRYRQLAETCERIAATAESRPSERVRALLTASFGWRAYGDRYHSARAMEAARAVAATAKEEATRVRLGATIVQREITLAMQGGQLSRAFGLGDARRLREEAAKAGERLLPMLTEAGALDARQALTHDLQRLGARVGHSDWPNAVEEGYRSLGLRNMEAIRARDWIRTAPWVLRRGKARVARRVLWTARRYGMRHEVWKLSWLLAWRARMPDRERRVLLRLWWRGFWAVEYAWYFRLFQIVYSLLPQGTQREFREQEFLASWGLAESPARVRGRVLNPSSNG